MPLSKKRRSAPTEPTTPPPDLPLEEAPEQTPEAEESVSSEEAAVEIIADSRPRRAEVAPKKKPHPYQSNLDEVAAQRANLEPLIVAAGATWDAWYSALVMFLMTANPALRECTPESITLAIAECARDGLLPDGKQAYLVPYYDYQRRTRVCRYQPTAPAIVKELRRSGVLERLNVQAVYEHDEFEVEYEPVTKVTHRTRNVMDRGAFVGVYAVGRFAGESEDKVEVMDRRVVEHVAKCADISAKRKERSNNTAWGEMYMPETGKKTVVRRFIKYAPTSLPEAVRRIVHRQDEMFNFNEVNRVLAEEKEKKALAMETTVEHVPAAPPPKPLPAPPPPPEEDDEAVFAELAR